jgi:hypothetical protein
MNDGIRKILVCTNRPDKQGELQVVKPAQLCDNHRPRPHPVIRLKPPRPANDQIRYIPLTKGKFAIVDKADFKWLSRFRWSCQDTKSGCYAVRHAKKHENYRRKAVFMHRLLAGDPEGLLVDHINGNSLDNRRANLRLATPSQNSCNKRKTKTQTSSRFKGVYYEKRRNNWPARIKIHGKSIRLGTFISEIDAARAYDRAAIKYHTVFARLNFPIEDYANEMNSLHQNANKNVENNE